MFSNTREIKGKLYYMLIVSPLVLPRINFCNIFFTNLPWGFSHTNSISKFYRTILNIIVGLLLGGDTNAPTNSVDRDCIIQTSFILLVHGSWVHAWGGIPIWKCACFNNVNNCTLLSSKRAVKRFLFTSLPPKVNSYWLPLPHFILQFHLSNFTHTSWTFLVFLLDLDLRLCISPPLLEGWCPHQCLNTFENISPPTYLFYVVHICWHQVYVLVRF
jgi:hypothetical protein